MYLRFVSLKTIEFAHLYSKLSFVLYFYFIWVKIEHKTGN
jgi:hypothetical protein